MASTLSPARFAAARAFVAEVGRPLDVAMLRHGLGEVPTEQILEALWPYQNVDGGFGHGLEPDIPSPGSSALASSVALRILARVKAPASHPVVTGVVGWLDGQIDRERGVWPIIGRDVDLAPHAPWWAWSDDLAASWNGFRFNPTAEILTWLYRFRPAVPAAVFAAAEAGMRRTLAETALIEGAYDLKCAVRLAESDDPPPDIARPLGLLVRSSLAAHDAADEHASPFDAAPTPASPFADVVDRRLEPAIGALIAAQADDGGWTPFWDWAFVDAGAWAKARDDWRGQLTREALETLLAWGRVERAAA